MLELTHDEIKEVIKKIIDEEKEACSRIKDLKFELYELETAGIYCDADRMEEIINELEILEPPTEEFQLSEEEIRTQKEKTKAMMHEALKKQERTVRITKTKKFIKRFSTVAAVLIFALTISASAFGFNIFALVAQWGKEMFSFGSSHNTECFASKLEEAIYKECDNLVDAYTAFQFPVTPPKWIPEGYEIDAIEIAHHITDVHVFMVRYRNEDKILAFAATIYHENLEKANSALEKSQENPLYFSYQGIDHHIMVNIGETTITWGKDNMIYKINGNITIEEAQEIIKSFY